MDRKLKIPSKAEEEDQPGHQMIRTLSKRAMRNLPRPSLQARCYPPFYTKVIKRRNGRLASIGICDAALKLVEPGPALSDLRRQSPPLPNVPIFHCNSAIPRQNVRRGITHLVARFILALRRVVTICPEGMTKNVGRLLYSGCNGHPLDGIKPAIF